MAISLTPRRKIEDTIPVVSAARPSSISIGNAPARQNIAVGSHPTANARVLAPTGRRSSAAPAAPQTSIFDRVKQFYNPVGQGGLNVFADAGNFVSNEMIRPTVEGAQYFGEGVGQAKIRGQQQRDFDKSQEFGQNLRMQMLQKANNPNASPAERDRYRRAANDIGAQMGQDIARNKGQMDEFLAKTDPIKQAGAVTTMASAIPYGGNVLKVAGAASGKLAKPLASQFLKEGALGSIFAVGDVAREHGADATAGDYGVAGALGFGIGGALGTALSAPAFAKARGDITVKTPQQAAEIIQEATKNNLATASLPKATAKGRAPEKASVDPEVLRQIQESGANGVFIKDNPYGAAYNTGTRNIYFDSPEAINDAALFHELGHSLWHNRLTPEEKSLFAGYSSDIRKQVDGRKGYTDDDYLSEEFSDMVSRALQGRIREVPPQFRDVVARHARVMADELEGQGLNPAQVAEAGEAIVQRRLQEQARNSAGKRPEGPTAEQKARQVVEANNPNVRAMELQQQLLEAEQLSNRPSDRMTPDEMPGIREQGDEIPVEFKTSAELGAEQRALRQEYQKSKVTLKGKLKDALYYKSPLGDDTGYAREMDKAWAKSLGVKNRDLPAEESLRERIWDMRSKESIDEQYLKDRGIADFASRLQNQETYDALNSYATHKSILEKAMANKKRTESLEQAYARYSGGRNLRQEEAAARWTETNNPEVVEYQREAVEIFRNILREHGQNPAHKLTPDQAEALIQKYPNYVPTARVLSEDINQFARSGRIGSGHADVTRKLQEGSKEKPIQDLLLSMVETSQRNTKAESRNRVESLIAQRYRDNPEMLRPLQTKEQLIAKENAIIEMAELREIAKPFETQLKKDAKWKSGLRSSIRDALAVEEGKKVVLRQGDKQVTLSVANMTDKQFSRLKANLAKQKGEYDNLVQEMETLRAAVDDIKSAKAGIMDSGALDAFEKNANKNILRAVDDGYEEVFEIMDPRMVKMFDALSPKDRGTMREFAATVTRAFKTTTTGALNMVAFPAVALGRAVFEGGLLARNPIKAMTSPEAHGTFWMAGAKKGDFFEELRRGGISGTHAESQRSADSAQLVSDLLRNQGLDRARIMFNIKRPVRSLKQMLREAEEVESATERSPRGGWSRARYEAQYDKYRDMFDGDEAKAHLYAMADARKEYRESGVNFAAGNEVSRAINDWVPYFLPAVNAARQIRQNIADRPAEMAARLGVMTTLIGSVTAYNYMDEDRKAIYEAIPDDDKRMNIIFVGPNAARNPETGEITGVLKWPLPHELLPATHAIQKGFEGATDEEMGNILLSGMTALTGITVTSPSDFAAQVTPLLAKPHVENITNYSLYQGGPLTPDYIKEEADGDRTKERKKNTSGTAMAISRATGGAVSPIEVDNLLRSHLGGASRDILSGSDKILNKMGLVEDGEVTDSNPFARTRDRFLKSYGTSDGAKFYDRIESISKGISNPADKRAFEMLHAKDKTPGILKTPENAVIMLNRPEVFAAEKKLNDYNKSVGKVGNPLFDLPAEQRNVVLSLQILKGTNPGDDAMVDVIEEQNPWLQEYYDKQSEFFDDMVQEKAAGAPKVTLKVVGEKGTKESTTTQPERNYTKTAKAEKDLLGITSPEYTDAISAKFRAASALTDPAVKAKFYEDNPELTQYLAGKEEFERAKRAYLGIPLLDKYPADPKLKELEKAYFAIPETNKAGRKAFINANPQLGDFWLSKNIWKMNEAGARNRFEGRSMNEEEMDDVMSVARSLSYASGGSGFGGGRGGGRGGSGGEKVLDPRRYRISLSAGGEAPKPKVSAKQTSSKGPRVYKPRENTKKTKVTWKKSQV